MDPTEAEEDIKKRWQEYTEELYKKDFHEPDNHHGVIAHLEPDIRSAKSGQRMGIFILHNVSRILLMKIYPIIRIFIAFVSVGIFKAPKPLGYE